MAGVAIWSQGLGQVTYPAAAYIWAAGLVLLLYGFVRDLYLLRQCRCEEAEQQGVQSSMICVESLVGLVVVGEGLLLHWLEWTPRLQAPVGLLLCVAAVVMAFGHLTRDWVLILATVPNHHNILPTWRIQSLDQIRQMDL